MNKTYVITGAASGIGKALVEHFAKENIVFAGVRRKECLAELRQISVNVIPFLIDLCIEESITSAVEFIKNKTDKIDTLINGAGCVVAGAIERIPVSELKRQFNTNVFGHLSFTQGLLELLDGGRIINISSIIFLYLINLIIK